VNYLVIIEGSGKSFSAYSPDLPGCVAAGESAEEAEQLMREAIPLHLESLRAHGDPTPGPQSSTLEKGVASITFLAASSTMNIRLSQLRKAAQLLGVAGRRVHPPASPPGS